MDVEGIALGTQHRLGGLVVRFEVFIRDWPRARRLVGGIIDKPGRILAEQHVRVDQRSSSETT